jgi:CheY-like chemotaxis protein
MGGEIEVESKAGGGSTFTLSVKADASGHLEAVQTVDTEAVTATEAISGHILLVEDNQNSSKLITLFLEMAGYDVKLAEDGQQAIDAVNAASPALILMDMNMPIMDGRTATQKIREAGFTMPVLALTASNDETIISGMRKAGCNGEIEKPVNADILIKSVSRYVS